jgi:hypothetical protein
MINRLSIPSSSWTQIDIKSPDVVGIQIAGAQGTLRILNIYNDCTHDRSLAAVEDAMRNMHARQGVRTPIRYLWMGDFNRHSPLWDEERNHHLFTAGALEAAD